MNALSVVVYGSLLAAVAAGVGAVVSPRLRSRLLVLAGLFFAIAGVLAILSIGVIFVAASVLCFAAAARRNVTASAPNT